MRNIKKHGKKQSKDKVIKRHRLRYDPDIRPIE